MLWFLRDKDEDKKKRRRRRSIQSSRKTERPDPGDRKRRSRRRPTPSSRPAREGQPREDTRDRDDARREKRQARHAREEAEETFASISYDGEDAQPDEIGEMLGHSLNKVLYVLFAALLLGVAIYGSERWVSARRAEAVRPVQEAAATGDIAALQALIDEGVPIDRIGPEGGTPLITAVREGQLGAVTMLLNAGAEPSDLAIQAALRHQRWDVLVTLVEAGGDANVRDTWHDRSPLEWATINNDVALVRRLLENGADPNDVAEAGLSAKPPLHYAAEHGLTEVAKVLLDHGADPNKLWVGYLPRHLAEDAEHMQLARILRQAERRGGAGAGR